MPASKKRRIIFIDNEENNLQDVEQALKAENIPCLIYHYQRSQIQVPPSSAEVKFPKSLDGFTEITSLGGGTESTFKITNPNSKETFVLKFGVHLESMQMENLCLALYRTMGVNTPQAAIYNTIPSELAKKLKLPSRYGTFQVSKYIEPDTDNHIDLAQVVSHNFIAHVLIGNIDIKHNFMTGTDKKVYLMDTGCNFIFRSLEEDRKEPPDLAAELESMRNPKICSVSDWFSSLSQDEIAEQVRGVARIANELESTIWRVSKQLNMSDALRQRVLTSFSERFYYLTSQYCPDMMQPKLDKKALPDKIEYQQKPIAKAVQL